MLNRQFLQKIYDPVEKYGETRKFREKFLKDVKPTITDLSELILKIFMFGKESPGKKHFLKVTTTLVFKDHEKTTIGADLRKKDVEFKGCTLHIQVWSFNPTERSRSLFPMVVSGSVGGIFVYDITDEESLVFFEEYIKDVKLAASALGTIVIVGVNLSLEEHRQVPKEEAFEFYVNRGIRGDLVEIKSKKEQDLEKPFKILCKKLFEV